MAQRQHSAPVILYGPESGSARVLSPVSGAMAPVDERRLQGLIARHPELIPIEEIEPAYAPLICLGQEVPTPAGPADVLYISPRGYLTLVETKLWRNPQARREVVGQVVDYAKELVSWSFNELDDAVRKAVQPEGRAGMGIIELLEAEDQVRDESQVIDTVTRNLKRGRLLLLIVGDGIREGVEAISSYLQDTPGLHFSLALLELALYQMEPGDEWPLLVQPRLVARTVEVVRAVVHVQAPEGVGVQVKLPETEEKGTRKGRRTLTEDVFFEELTAAKGEAVADEVGALIDDLTQLGLVKRWASSSVSMRLPDPRDTGQDFTVVLFTTGGEFYVGWLIRAHTKGGYDLAVVDRYLKGVIELTGAELWDRGDGVRYEDTTKRTPVDALLRNKEEFLALVREFKNAVETQAAEWD